MEFREIINCTQIAAYVLGIFGSVMIILIMLRPTFRSMPRTLVCISLAGVDLLFLTYNLVVQTYRVINSVQLIVTIPIVCKVNGFLLYYFTHLDSFFITILTLERLLAVVKPYKVNQIVTAFKIKILIITSVVIFLTWDAELFFRKDLDYVRNPRTKETISLCRDMNYYGLPTKIFEIKDLISILLRSFIPMGIIVPANLVIIIKLFRQKQERSRMTTGRANSSEQTSRVTWMIVSASLSYVLTVAPINIYLFATDNKTDIILPILGLIYRINPVLNFYLYFLSGGLFKAEVKIFLTSLKVKLCRSSSGPLPTINSTAGP